MRKMLNGEEFFFFNNMYQIFVPFFAHVSSMHYLHNDGEINERWM